MDVKIFYHSLINRIVLFNSKSEENLCKTDFNRDWTVQKDGSNEILHVNLPDDAMIREERSKENKTASASAYFAGGKYIYTKIFDLSENETRQTLILEFEVSS